MIFRQEENKDRQSIVGTTIYSVLSIRGKLQCSVQNPASMQGHFTCEDLLTSHCRAKRKNRTVFNLTNAVHKSEYSSIPRPTEKKTKRPIEPAHKFEVTLEPDKFTKEKYAYEAPDKALSDRIQTSSYG